MILGNTQGLKSSEIRTLEKLSKRRDSAHEIISWPTLKLLTETCSKIDKTLGLLINRKGNVTLVIVGDRRQAKLPTHLKIPFKLNGHRFIRTAFESLDFTLPEKSDLISRELDLISIVTVQPKTGLPNKMIAAHLDTENLDDASSIIHVSHIMQAHEFDIDQTSLFEYLDAREKRRQTLKVKKTNQAYLIAAKLRNMNFLDHDLDEMKELAKTLGIHVEKTFIQPRGQLDPKYAIGRGRLDQILEQSMLEGASHLLFLQNLSPNQLRLISQLTDCEVMDRTQLILEIFAKRATSHDGKLQVELARLKYMIPRLREREKELSRLVGGIGGQGPGETKLEIFRRRARDRINRLEKDIQKLSMKRASKRSLRKRRDVPIVSLVGYTNAGKSTLLNTLTNASALAENKPFATLDPFSKRLRFPEDRELILTDTVGFIRDLPKDLMNAFRSTLEEIGEANLIVHLVDIFHPNYEERISAVVHILEELGFQDIPRLLVFNKTDLLTEIDADILIRKHGAIGISALHASTCRVLIEKIQDLLWSRSGYSSSSPSSNSSPVSGTITKLP